MDKTLKIGTHSFQSRLMVGTGKYKDFEETKSAITASGAEVVTVALRRTKMGQNKDEPNLLDFIDPNKWTILPNTAGCHTVKEAITTAHMAREIFSTKWIKLEVIGEEDTLQPDVFGLVEASKILSDEGFEVFPYTTEDLVVAEKLLNAGCKVLMPWVSTI